MKPGVHVWTWYFPSSCITPPAQTYKRLSSASPVLRLGSSPQHGYHICKTQCPYLLPLMPARGGPLRPIDLPHRCPHYHIDHYVKDGGLQWVPLFSPPPRMEFSAVLSHCPWYHHLTIPLTPNYTLQVRADYVSPQYFHAARPIQ